MRHRGAGLLLALAVAVLAGCGSSHARRDEVNTYFQKVDQAQQDLLASTGEIDAAFRSFSLTSNTQAESRELERARAEIGRALTRVRAVQPPPEARGLHADLVHLLALELSVSHDLVWTITYQPRLSSALAPLPAAGKRLAREIAAVGTTPLPSASVSGSTGSAVWNQAGCGSCHSFAAAGSKGSRGPDLDLLHPSAAVVAARVRSGGGGMPAYRSKLSAAQIDALSSFVAANERQVPTTAESLNEYGAAFKRFGVALRGVLADLDRLSAPPELRPALVAERRALAKNATLCETIAAALAKQDVNGANASIRELFATSADVSSAATQQEQAAAVAAYNTRLHRISALATRISRERQHLVQTLG